MSSGVQRTVRGSFTGTGSDLEVKGDRVGFRPRAVKLVNVTGLVKAEWQEGMANDSAIKCVTTGDMTLIATNGITPLADGFAVGADIDINVAAEVVFFEATE